MKLTPTDYLDFHPDVAQALSQQKAVVALESTIIAHGMPYPQNVETAKALEAIVREQGAVPATIALIDGRVKVGLSPEELELIGKKGPEVQKCSRRDFPILIQSKKLGATTVAATMIVAQWAGIRIFATGGIGGVHRGGQDSFDISADLQELAHTSVAVVCAGAKSILDLDRTLEYLETHGVPVLAYQSDEFPAFYTRYSGLGVDHNASSVAEIADILRIKWDLQLQGGVLIANPIPEAHSMDPQLIENIIEQALSEAETNAIRGKELTPFLLAKVEALTQGDSLAANIQLVYHNTRLAAQIARSFYQK